MVRHDTNDNIWKVEGLEADKVEKRDYKKAIDILASDVDQLRKRQKHDEIETQSFGEYILRYMPLMLQNQISKNICECLDYKAINKFKVF